MIFDFRQLRKSGNFIRDAGDGGWSLARRANDIQVRGDCPYCKVPLGVAFRTQDYPGLEYDYDNDRTVSTCPDCGFWTVYKYTACDSATIAYMEEFFEAYLRNFEVSSAQIPVETLRAYLKKNEARFHEVNPTKFEELVGSVFRDVLQCEARHVGRTGDGGIDLIVLDAETPLAIQVKRRRDGRSTEGVDTVRTFLGAILLKGVQRGAIVTTARAFSPAGIAAASTAQKLSLVRQFNLIDFPSFLSMYRLVADRDVHPWLQGVPQVFQQARHRSALDEAAKLEAYYEWERRGRQLLSDGERDAMYFEALNRGATSLPQTE
jgi:restriction system protein